MQALLIDNGSLRADSVLNLRAVARALSERVGHEVVPVSLLHSSKIDPAALEGEPALVWERYTREQIEAGERDFYVIPFFFGPTGAIEDYLPERLERLRERLGDIHVQVAPFLFDAEEVDLAQILAARIREVQQQHGLRDVPVALCDHGSPKPEVAAVRDALAQQLTDILNHQVVPCSMERREGPEYDFNEPLLERLLRQPGFHDSPLIVSLLFLSPGRHAGEGGDVATICAEAERVFPNLQTYRTDLVGTHPAIVDILEQRFIKGLVQPRLI
ncbi:MAG: cobalamin (vitamin B12) biosynthesis CbiX protein [Puniceicoccaceae bacterium 5H]|nr:MAG: cobalamin (vitamin B12) biosynthesis CbiX protein [Puniceicoccaceae bacterium 5H]